MSSDTDTPLISLKEVQFKYSGESNIRVLNLPSWKVSAGERVLLIGCSGSGKSTLLNLLSGILAPDTGEILVDGKALENLTDRQRDHFRATRIGYVAQNFNLIPYLSSIDNIRLTQYFASTDGRKEERSRSSDLAINALLLELNIEQTLWQKPISHLSIGQQQRVAIARAIVNRPKILIADEPTSALDEANRDQFMSILMTTAHTHDMTLVFVSHDLSLKHHFNRVDSMSDINKIEG